MKAGFYIQLWAYWISRLLLGVIFIYAATSKLGAPQDFADSLGAYRLLPPATINLLAWGLPLFELCCGLCVLTGFCFRIGAVGILAMLSVFVVAIVSTLVRGLSIDCGCFAAHSWLDTNPWIALVRDIFLILLTTLAYRHRLANEFPRAVGNSSKPVRD